MIGVILMSCVSACISFTVADTRAFEWLREYAEGRSKFFHLLLSCGYCVGFYASAAIELIWQPNLFGINIIGEIATWLVIAWFSGVQWAVMRYVWGLSG